MNKKRLLSVIAILLLILLCTAGASAEEAHDLSSGCKFKSDGNAWNMKRLTDGKYQTYWQSGKIKNPYLIISSDEPMYSLYLCFREMPESYELQRKENDQWVSFAEGDTRFHHVCYDLNGETEIRILSTQQKKHRLIFNEVYVFGAGEIPDWVQRWEETEEKADLMLLVAHPDDELLFFAGTIPTYNTELKKRMVIVYLTNADSTRRSEALNGLWTLGVRHYPVFGPFQDKYTHSLSAAYKHAGKTKVLSWITELFRKYKPEVVLTHDIKGEYGHCQHRMMADACIKCYDLAADAENYPESAETYGTWEVKKLYIHRYGEKTERLHFEWDVPLESLGGKTGMEMAAEAFSKHETQTSLYFRIGGYRKPLSVEETGVYYENTDFGLYASRVGADEKKDSFLEHIE